MICFIADRGGSVGIDLTLSPSFVRTSPLSGNRAFFLYDDWLTGDKRRVQLVPGRIGENNTYKVVVRTSDVRGAGTDSNITICMFGTKDGQSVDSKTHKLDDSKASGEGGGDDD